MDLLKKLRKIERLKTELESISSDKVWDNDFINKVKTHFTYYSNKIEGNAITFGQTIQLLKNFVAPKNTSIGDCLDILNHQRVLDEVFKEYASTQISEISIKRIHKELMKNPDQWGDSIHYAPGKYKIIENLTIRPSGKIHEYAQPDQVRTQMAYLIKSTNKRMLNATNNGTEDNILSIATDFHYIFLNIIHPFGDGNGRLARIFMNLILIKSGYPPIFIKSVDKNKYMECFALEEIKSGTMLDFMADRMLESFKEKKIFLAKTTL